MTKAICRSALYMPASNDRALQKGPSLLADAIIIDLEDSVAPDAKAHAREQAVAALSNYDYGYRLRVLRLNGLDTEWFSEDVAMLGAVKPDAVLLPKVESADAIAQVHRSIDAADAAGNIALWAMLETPKAVVNAVSIAQASSTCKRLQTFCVGNNDLAREAGMKVTSDRTLLMPWLMSLVLAAKSQALNILDGVYNDFADVDGCARECEQGAAMGMDGKTLIHPAQIPLANNAYGPGEEEIKNAQNIVKAFSKKENVGKGVLQIDGRMVERLHLDMAQQTLALAQRIERNKNPN